MNDRCSPRHWLLLVSTSVAIGGMIGNPARAENPPSSGEAPLFSRHAVPVMARLGCNAGGACHGTVLGQGSFRLSLFGGQPLQDYKYLTREFGARRLNPLQPEQSLILLKATAQVPHGGGKRTEIDSEDYRVLLRWIAAGARLDNLEQSRLVQLTASPASLVLKSGAGDQVRVTAKYRDGSTADVTRLCRYEVRDQEVADVSSFGQVQGRGRGDTALLIRYGAEPTLVPVMVAAERRKHFLEIKGNNFIDEHILAKLRMLDLPPAPLCDDATFLRRLYLDVTGYLPPPDEVRAFLADKSADKRDRKIDELLAKPGYAEIWAAKLSDLIKPVERGNEGSNNLLGGQTLRIRFYEWLRARLQENVPYDRLVERIFLSSSLEGRPIEQWLRERGELREELAKKKPKDRPLGVPLLAAYNQRRTLDLFWERDGATGVSGAMQFAHAFLGLRLQCAQCHRHPYDVWQQDDLLSFANFFTAMNTAPGQRRNSPEVTTYLARIKTDIQNWTAEIKKLGPSKDAKDKARVAQLQAQVRAAQAIGQDEVAPLTKGPVALASVRNSLGTQTSGELRLLGQKANITLAPAQDRRKLVMDWLHRPDNPYFARAMVNRVWAHYLGRGIIDPPDNLSPLNPPSHPQLLDKLGRQFVQSGYDLRALHRTILRSRTYQQSHEAHPASAGDRRNYARFYLRRLPGEVILDVVNQATGTREKYPASWMFREGERAVLTAGVMVDVYNFYNINDPFRYLVFGRQLRRANVQCDCEQGRDVSLTQLLFLANHEEVRKKIAAANGRPAQLAANAKLDNRQRVEELFLNTLGRPPDPKELKAGLDHLNTSNNLRKGLEELLWSLVNTREFQLNY